MFYMIPSGREDEDTNPPEFISSIIPIGKYSLNLKN